MQHAVDAVMTVDTRLVVWLKNDRLAIARRLYCDAQAYGMVQGATGWGRVWVPG